MRNLRANAHHVALCWRGVWEASITWLKYRKKAEIPPIEDLPHISSKKKHTHATSGATSDLLKVCIMGSPIYRNTSSPND